ncbi:MAG: tol-pal system protein YbgF [Hyphomicrobiales bacterium]|nr:tol-pal system protein YbgF [Hyphomicrobiales bacterium]
MSQRRSLHGFVFLTGAMLGFAAMAQSGGLTGAPQGVDLQAIDRRIDKLEEQIIDLQSQAAALESLANNAPATRDGGAGFGADGGGGGQNQALSAQVAELTQRLQQLERQLGFAPPRSSGPPPSANAGPPPLQNREPLNSQPSRQSPQGYASEQNRPGGGFGSTTVEPGGSSGGAFSSEPPRRYASPQGAGPQTGAPAYGGGSDAQPARFSSGEAKTLYDQAYGSLVKREYQAAETYFTQFLKQHPSDPLAGPAQFWLGETAFVSGEYRQAADMFLKSYTNYPASEKAPESLLKLGLSLKRLGESSEACNTFSELEQRFPQAQAVIQRAQAEKRRSNC